MIPGISQDKEPQISHSLPVAFSDSCSLPVKRECDFQFPFPFPGAKKPFPLTPGPEDLSKLRHWPFHMMVLHKSTYDTVSDVVESKVHQCQQISDA